MLEMLRRAGAVVVLLLAPWPPAGASIFSDGFESGDACVWSLVWSSDPCDGQDNDCDGITDEDAACDDSIECTLDWCDGFMGCANDPDDQTCDDQIPCTMDFCDPSLDCQSPIDPNYCLIGDGCVEQGTQHPVHPYCQRCTPSSSQTEWTVLYGTQCDDDDACTIGDQCSEDGVCIGDDDPCPPPDPNCPSGYFCVELLGLPECFCSEGAS